MRLTCFLLLLTTVNSLLLQYNHERKISNPNTFASSSVATQNEDLSSPTRREFLSSSAAGIIVGSGCLQPSSASAEENLGDFEDATWKFSIKVPTGWEQSVQSLPDRRKIVLYIKPDSNQKTLCFIAYTPVRADFTSLGSFGSVDAVSSKLICS
jgi:PsbP